MGRVRARPRLTFTCCLVGVGVAASALRGNWGVSSCGRRLLRGLRRHLCGGRSRWGAQAWRHTGAHLREVTEQLLDLGSEPLRGRCARVLRLRDRGEPSVDLVDMRLKRLLGQHHVLYLSPHAVDVFGKGVVLVLHMV